MSNGFEMIQRAIGSRDPSSLCMFELGDQVIHKALGISERTGKEYYTRLGLRHVSLDLNGRNGALRRDITEDVSDLGAFDIVTNLGSSEHVEPLVRQYLCFANLHRLCRAGGFIVHHVPPVGEWPEHSPAHYREDFFPRLAAANDYEVMSFCFVDSDRLTSCSLRKRSEAPFMPAADFPYDQIRWNDANENRGDYTSVAPA